MTNALARDDLDLARVARDSGDLLRRIRPTDPPTDDAVRLLVDLLGHGGRIHRAAHVAAETRRLEEDPAGPFDELADLLAEALVCAHRLAGKSPATA